MRDPERPERRGPQVQGRGGLSDAERLAPDSAERLATDSAERLATDSAAHWRAVRRQLSLHRPELTEVAGRCYPSAARAGPSALLYRADWIPDRPLELGEVRLNWTEPAPVPIVTGIGSVSRHVRPLRADGTRYPAYADALAALDPPALLENRPCYRLLSARLTTGMSQLDLARGRYFDGVNVGEALAHELADAWAVGPQPAGPAGPAASAGPAGPAASAASAASAVLPIRDLTGDPCDLSRRSAICAITTLTLRRATPGNASFLLHWRDPAQVTHAGGLHQVMPVGIFQPADDHPVSERSDLSLWRSMAREFSEELLGTTEDYDDLGSPVDYDRWPFYRELSAARAAGRLRVHCLGLGVDPLSLAVDILTVAVFDGDVFDALFGDLVAVNAEGRVIGGRGASGTSGVPFTGEIIRRFAGGGQPMQAAGAAVLQLAWRHRARLLG
jgi:hypothetical protein